jgi:hypothetical protein
MADVQTSVVYAKPVPASLGLSRVMFSNHDNQTILVWQLKPYLCNSWSHSWTYCWLVVYLTIHNAFSVTRLCSVHDRVISEWWWIGKDMVGSGCGLTLRHYPGIFLEVLRKTTKNLSQGSWLQGPRFEPGTSWIPSRSVSHSTTTFGDLSFNRSNSSRWCNDGHRGT